MENETNPVDARESGVDNVEGRDPQRVLDVLAKAEEAAERRLADVDSWYEQAKGHLADFATSVQQAGERLTSRVESLRGTMPGTQLTGTPSLPPLPPPLDAPADLLTAQPDASDPEAAERRARLTITAADSDYDVPAGAEFAVDTPGAASVPAESSGDPVADSLREYQIRLLANSEHAADQLLASAEEQAAQIVQDARAQADQVMRSAKFHSERMIGNARMEAAVTGRRVAELRALERKLRDSIKGFLSGDEQAADPELDYQSPAELLSGVRPRQADHPIPHPQSVEHLVAAHPRPLEHQHPGAPAEPLPTDPPLFDDHPTAAHPTVAAAEPPAPPDSPAETPVEPVRYPPSSSPVLPGDER